MEVPVTAGEHTVQVRIDWSGSPMVTFDPRPGQVAALVCRPAGTAFSSWQAFTREGWISLSAA